MTPDGPDALLTVGLAHRGLRLAFGCGRHRWAEGTLSGPGADRQARGIPAGQPTPVVCRGGWTGPDVFEADLVLIETPHRIRLTGNGTRLVARWNAPPLTGAALEAQLGS